MLLEREPGMKIVDEAEDGYKAVLKALQHVPDVAVLDIGMPNLNGIEATRQIRKRQPGMKVLILTMHETEEYITAILEAGASGYLLKNPPLRSRFERSRQYTGAIRI
jgi:DNA-binding NarL/FixJ family response regulator